MRLLFPLNGTIVGTERGRLLKEREKGTRTGLLELPDRWPLFCSQLGYQVLLLRLLLLLGLCVAQWHFLFLSATFSFSDEFLEEHRVLGDQDTRQSMVTGDQGTLSVFSVSSSTEPHIRCSQLSELCHLCAFFPAANSRSS